MKDSVNQLDLSVNAILEHLPLQPGIGIILGSGLGDFADSLSEATHLETNSIPYYPKSTVEGHRGRLIFGSLASKQVMLFQGRVHFYETGQTDPILYPIKIAHRLGVRLLIVTNAAGGVSRKLVPGDLMIVTDQVNLTFGQYKPAGKIRGPLYDAGLVDLLSDVATSLGITLHSGVYVGVKGPSYETAAEVEMIHRIGGDAVGMSTVFETALASSLGLRVAGISLITNLGTGISPSKLHHAEVTEVAQRAGHRFRTLLHAFLGSLP
jgi:purine-nucleoside phosphorylase